MFGWALAFLVVAIVAGISGFASVAGTAAWVARMLFVVGLVWFLASLTGPTAGRGPMSRIADKIIASKQALEAPRRHASPPGDRSGRASAAGARPVAASALHPHDST